METESDRFEADIVSVREWEGTRVSSIYGTAHAVVLRDHDPLTSRRVQANACLDGGFEFIVYALTKPQLGPGLFRVTPLGIVLWGWPSGPAKHDAAKEPKKEVEAPQQREFELLSVTVDAWCPIRGTGYTVVPMESLAFTAWAPTSGVGLQIVGRTARDAYRVWSHKGAPSLGRQTFRRVVIDGKSRVEWLETPQSVTEESKERPEERPEEKPRDTAKSEMQKETPQQSSHRFEAHVLGVRQWPGRAPEASLEFGAAHPVSVRQCDREHFAKRGKLGLSTWIDPTYTVYAHGEPSVGLGVFEVWGDARLHWVGPVSKPTAEPSQSESKSKNDSEEFEAVIATSRPGQPVRRDSLGVAYEVHVQETTPFTSRGRCPIPYHGSFIVWSHSEPQVGAGRFRLVSLPNDDYKHVLWLGLAKSEASPVSPQTPPTTDHSAAFRDLLRAFCRSHAITMLDTRPDELDAFHGPLKQQATVYLQDRVQPCSQCHRDEVLKAEPVRDTLVNLALNTVISIDTRRATQLWVECRCVNVNDGTGIYVATLYYSTRVD